MSVNHGNWYNYESTVKCKKAKVSTTYSNQFNVSVNHKNCYPCLSTVKCRKSTAQSDRWFSNNRDQAKLPASDNFLLKKAGLENRHKSGPAEGDFRIPSYITQTTCRFLGPAFWTQEITKLTHCFWCVICLCFRTITSIGQDPFVIITRSNFELQKLPKFGIRVSHAMIQK